MIASNIIMSPDNKTHLTQPPMGIPVNSELNNYPLYMNNANKIFVPNPEAQPVLNQNAAQSIVNAPAQGNQLPTITYLICKSFLFYFIVSIIQGVYIYFQTYMLGFFATWMLLIIGQFYVIYLEILFIYFILIVSADQKDYKFGIQIARFFLLLSLLSALACFFLSIFYPVRNIFHNPEAFEIIRTYNYVNNDYYFNDSKNTDFYYLFDMCQAICSSSHGNLDRSSDQYCQNLLNGSIKENNLQNLNGQQIGLIIYYILALIFIIIIFYQEFKLSGLIMIQIPKPKRQQIQQGEQVDYLE